MLSFPSSSLSSCFLPLQSSSILKLKHPPPQLILQQTSIKLKAAASSDYSPQVDYNSMATSVFPAEACETLGGVACDVEMFPETKLKQPKPLKPLKPLKLTASQTVDREYNSPKTVFIAEACDDLGGEFCDAPYQTQPT